MKRSGLAIALILAVLLAGCGPQIPLKTYTLEPGEKATFLIPYNGSVVKLQVANEYGEIITFTDFTGNPRNYSYPICETCPRKYVQSVYYSAQGKNLVLEVPGNWAKH